MNLIVISCDELRADAAGFMHNPDCLTPNLDRLASRSVVFDRHYTVHGKCVPSRIAMMTGRYCHTDGIRSINHDNHIDAETTPNLLTTLRRHGYETAYFGHNHVFRELHNGDNRPGVGPVDLHSFSDGIFGEMLSTEHPVQQPNASSRPVPVAPSNLSVGRITAPRTGFVDDNRALQAVHYLENVRDRQRPFYMHLNFGAPHPAYDVEEPYFSMYDPEKLTSYVHGIPENAPLPLTKMREIRSSGGTELHFRNIQAVYYAKITKVDTLIGQVLDAIDRQRLWDDTAVMFWVDHGDFAGQYGLPEKWDTAMQDCIMRVPQTLAAPGLPQGKRIRSLTDHTDIAPTVLALLNVKHQEDWLLHGMSLLPVIQGADQREAIFADGGHETEMAQRFNFKLRTKEGHPATLGKQQTYHDEPDTMARTKMIRTDPWKLVIRLAGGNELYNMDEDPNEMRNLYGQPEYNDIVRDLQLKMLEWCLRTDTDRPHQKQVGA